VDSLKISTTPELSYSFAGIRDPFGPSTANKNIYSKSVAGSQTICQTEGLENVHYQTALAPSAYNGNLVKIVYSTHGYKDCWEASDTDHKPYEETPGNFIFSWVKKN
jgi:hypothetical protein